MSKIRYDFLHNEYVIIAPERLHRPNVSLLKKREKIETVAKCPFCKGNEALTGQEIFAIYKNPADKSSWQIRVIPNLYKAVQIETEFKMQREGFFESINGYGAHEIIIDTPCHNCTLADLEIEDIENWLKTIAFRKADLTKDKQMKYFIAFKNSGKRAGASQEHPHTQIIALPVVPKSKIDFLQRNSEYYRKFGHGILEDIIYNEKTEKVRVVKELGNFIAFCPYASAFAFEVMIAPLQNFFDLNDCSNKDLSDLALLVSDTFKALYRELGDFDFNISFEFAPINSNFEEKAYMQDLRDNYRFYIRIIPRIFTLAGFEVATNMAINPIMPKECAQFLRGDGK